MNIDFFDIDFNIAKTIDNHTFSKQKKRFNQMHIL